MRHPCFLLLALIAAAIGPRPTPAAEPGLKDGDRVVLIGSTLIERDQSYGYLETLLTCRYPDRNITFRNLGWSGDTVWGEAQAGFGTAADGFRHLKEHVEALKPTVILAGYGTNESFAGQEGLSRFVEGLNTLLDTLDKTGARIVLLTPNRLEDLGRPLPDPARHNADLLLYRDAIRATAKTRGLGCIDLFESLRAPQPESHLTNDGLHLTPTGYRVAAGVIADCLGLTLPPWGVSIKADGSEVQAHGTTLTDVERTDRGLRFEAKDETLPSPPFPDKAEKGSPDRKLVVRRLPEGDYLLKIDDREVAKLHSIGDETSIPLSQGPEFDQVERLRTLINEKNRLYFHRWRPQNETYLFGFRKHEQGQNAREIPEFDPLVAQKESEIARLKKPTVHRYELIRQEERR